jgi:outer membrane protein OmpA-like peptidoglycan-associated protein
MPLTFPSRRRSLLQAAALALLLCHEPAAAQHAPGLWTLDLRAGTNIYMTSFNTNVVGPGGEVTVAYDLSPAFSTVLSVGYEELKSHEIPFPADLPYDYIKLHALQTSLTGTLRPLSGGALLPYVYLGAGLVTFKRLDGGKNPIPDDAFHSSFIIPVGLGLEAAISSQIALVLDAGMRFGGAELDAYASSSSGSYLSTKAGLRFFLSDPGSSDADGDGLTAAEEEKAGTGDAVRDSDGDGLTDGEEVHRYRSNPLVQDSDADGIPDGTEALTSGTDPARADTDGDGIPDRDELHVTGTAPTRADTDGDGLQDGAEAAAGSDPLVPDTDGDGLTDREEVSTYGSNPRSMDSDDDGLPDGEEVKRFRSSPTRADSDGGGVTDGVEVQRGMNPLNPRDDGLQEGMILQRGRTVILEGVGFAAGSTNLTKESTPALERLLVALLADPRAQVEIVGHTDGSGDPGVNRRISRSRAEAVKGWLVRRGVAADRLIASGMGSETPLEPNTTPQGRARNRRIELRVLP